MIWKTTLAFLVAFLNVLGYPFAQKKNFRLIRIPFMVAILSAKLLFTGNLYAQIAPVVEPTGGFHIDGDLQSNTPTQGIGDWVAGPAGTGGHVFNLNGSPVNAARTFRVTDPFNSNTDNIFQGGGKFNDDPNTWKWTSGKANGKGDINNVLLHIAEDADNDQWIIVGSDRYVTNGTSYIDFEFLQNELSADAGGTFSSSGIHGGRTLGDLLIAVEYTGGGNIATVRYYEWEASGTGYDYVEKNDPGPSRFGQSNSEVITTPLGAFGVNQYQPFQFVEAAINVTAFFEIFNPCQGITIGNILIKTKSSAAATAALDDFVMPVDVKLNLGTASIEYNSDDFCSTTATPVINGVQGGNFDSAEGLNIDSETGNIDLENSTPGAYTITYSFTTANCPKSVTVDVVIPETAPVPVVQDLTFCEESGVQDYGITAAAGYTLTYYSSNEAETPLENTPTVNTGESGIGEFSVWVSQFKADECASDRVQVKIMVNELPEVSVSNDNGLELSCSVPLTNLTASGGVSYSWSNGTEEVGKDAVLEVTTAGTYTVTVTNANECTNEASVTVSENKTQAEAIITGNETLTCELTSVTLDASSSTADGNFTYLWSDGSSESTLTVTEVGSYSVTITGENGCSDEASVTVEENVTPANVVITGNEILTCELTSVTLDARTSTADGEFSYLWSDGSTNATLTVTNPGIYSVIITGENGCSDEASVSIEENITPANALITGNETLTCEITSVTLDASSSTADGDFTYLWNDGSTNATLTVTDPGTYSVTITGENGCSDEASVTVEENATTANAVITGNETLTCNTTSITLDAGSSTADGKFTYLWNDGSTGSTLVVTEAGSYSVTITGENGCSDEASVTVEENVTPANAVITGNEILTCELTSVTLNASTSTADGEFFYLWDDGSTNATLTITNPGTYSVIITGENGCSDEASVTVEENITPANAVITGNETLTCEITSVTLNASSSTADGDFSYLWNDGSTNATLTVTDPGTYSVTITGENGCSDEASVNVEENATTANAVITGNETLTCNITSITLDAGSSNADGKFTYLWSDGSSESTLAVTEAGSYSVTITGENGCSDEASVTVEENITPANAVITGNETLTCQITSVILDGSSSTADGNLTYLWSNGSIESALTVTEPGIYSVTVTGENGCSDETSVTVEENITPANAVITGNETLTCEITSVTLDASSSTADGDFTYLWNDGSTNATLTVTEPGTYSVTITGENGCSDEASVTVEENATTATAVITGNEILDCNITSITLDAGSSTADGDFTYLWSDGSTESTLSVTEAGTYSVIITGENGCSDEASETVIFLPDTENPEVEKLKDISVNVDIGNCSAIVEYTLPTAIDNCSGALVTLDEGSLTSGSAFPVGTTTVNYTATDASGNKTSVSFTVTVIDNEAPVADMEALETVTGQCSATVSAVPTATDNCGGTIEGTTQDALTYNEQGTYIVTWTFDDGNGNITTQEQTVIVNDTTAPVADMEALETVTGQCSATVSAVPTATDNCGGTIQGITEDDLTFNEQGTYTVTWTFDDGNGNITTQEQTVIVNDTTAPVADMEALETVTGQCSATVSAVPTATDNCGGTIQGITEDDLTFNEQGTYTVIWTFDDGNGNITTQEQTVIVNDTTAPVADMEALETVTGQCSATVSAVPTATDNCGGTLEGTTEDTLTYNEQGTYTITWTFDDGNGNITTQEQTVIVNDTTAPVADMEALETVTGQCSATVSAVPTATDNCGGTIEGTTEDALTYNEQGTYTITWTFDDGNGNITTQEQTVIVDDVTAPVADIDELPTVTGECSATVSAVPTATDNCGGTLEGTTQDALTYNEQGTYTVTWTFNDGNGNITTQEQTVIVNDTTAPVADTEALETVTGECSATVSAVPTATDTCEGTVQGTTEDALTYNEQGTYTVTWTFDDGNGNITTQEQTVIVNDTTAPVADATELQTLTSACEVVVSVIPTATDNCEGTIEGTTSDAFTYNADGTYVITWTFDDANGNISTQQQTVIIESLTAPVVASTTQPTCDITTGSFSITAVEGLDYSLNGGAYAATTSFDGLAAGNYTVTARNADGCESEAVTVTIDAQPESPVTPLVADVTQPSCDITTGSFSITATEGLEYSLNGGAFDSTISFEGLAPGTYSVTSRNTDGCESEALSVTINDQPSGPATPVVASITQPGCEGETGSFSITAVEGLEYSLDGGAFGTTTSFEDLDAGAYTVTARNADGCESEALVITIEEPQRNATVNTTPVKICDDPQSFYDLNTLVSENGVTGTWEDTDATEALSGSRIDTSIPEPGIYTFTYVIEGDCPSTTSVTVEIEDCGEVARCSLGDIRDTISKAVTPNGDGFNDFFTIDIDNECEYTYNVKIFNRWGAEIFTVNNYQNNWDGFSNKSVSSSNQLPSGTYYYIVEIIEGNGSRIFEPIQGYIYLGTK